MLIGTISSASTYNDVKKLTANGQIKEALKLFEKAPDTFTATSLFSYSYKNLKDLPLCLRSRNQIGILIN